MGQSYMGYVRGGDKSRRIAQIFRDQATLIQAHTLNCTFAYMKLGLNHCSPNGRLDVGNCIAIETHYRDSYQNQLRNIPIWATINICYKI